jgi:outer membrane protein OmpA-like peptidoglycan-associated protein
MYPVLVRARNGVGAGAAAGPKPGTPATVPGAPRSVHASQSGTAAVIKWTRPASNGGSPITGYRVTASPSGRHCTTTGTTCRIAGLPTGCRYTFAVRADNATDRLPGTGIGAAGFSAPVMISGRPGAPRRVSAHPGDRVLRVQFTAPASNGGAPITGYQISLNGGLLNGATYRVEVRAINRHGAGPASNVARVKLPMWFHDPISRTARHHEIAVPAHPAHYRGPLRSTRAAAKSHTGRPAFPAPRLNGRQLQPGQATTLGTGAVFAFDSGTLTRAGRQAVAAVARSLGYVHAVTCEGYTDYGGRARHQVTLAAKRAHTVCAELVRRGVHVRTSTRSYGASYPVVVGGTAADRAANRRVVIVVTG